MEEAAPTPVADDLRVTEHEVTIDGQQVRYRATAGLVTIRQESAHTEESAAPKPVAQVFITAYERLGVPDTNTRPITFAYNGGPGSSAVWLHLGAFGPYRVPLGNDGEAVHAPFKITENEHSLLDVSDLVFIDPVSTGWSRPTDGNKAADFHTFDADVEAVAEVIRSWLGRTNRWLSPKYLAGESYGTMRSAALAGYLQTRFGVAMSGVMLVSSVLDFQTLRFDEGNDLPPLLYVPAFAATARYHGRLSAEYQAVPLSEFLAEVEAFTMNEYALALLRGATLPAEQYDAIAKRLAAYTGLRTEFVKNNRLRIDIRRFTKELLRDEGLTVGRLDSRYTGSDRDSGGEHFEYDPAYSVIYGPYTAAFNYYVREHLEFSRDFPYEIIAGVFKTWKYDTFTNRYVTTVDTLRQAMAQNPALRVHVASGYYDLATPYFASDYTMNHLWLREHERSRVSVSYYEAGHMMYVQQQSLAALAKELRSFIEEGLHG